MGPFEDVEKRHDRYIAYGNFHPDLLKKSTKCMKEVYKRQLDTLRKISERLNVLSTPSTIGSRRSSRSKSSTSSSIHSKLLDIELKQKEAELKLQQERDEAQRRADEEEQLMKLELNPKRSERLVEAARRERQLDNDIAQLNLQSTVLRKQLRDDNIPLTFGLSGMPSEPAIESDNAKQTTTIQNPAKYMKTFWSWNSETKNAPAALQPSTTVPLTTETATSQSQSTTIACSPANNSNLKLSVANTVQAANTLLTRFSNQGSVQSLSTTGAPPNSI